MLFLDFVDREFGWDSINTQKKYPKGINLEWGGIIHHPYQINEYWGHNLSVSSYTNSKLWKDSLKTCKFLITLSEDLKNKILENDLLAGNKIPMYSLKHPSDFVQNNFKLDNFLDKSEKCLTFIGWSFRYFKNFFELLPPIGFKKVWVRNIKSGEQSKRIDNILMEQKVDLDKYRNVQIKENLSRLDYEKLICGSIVFLDFEETSANCAVVECVSRNIPILVKNHSALHEYLGKDYPLYFESINDCPRLLTNSKIIETHNHLKKMCKKSSHLDNFIQNVHDVTRTNFGN
jgi:hypothetical protein